MIHMVIKKKKKPAFTLSEKKYPVFQPVEKKYPRFPAEEKKDGFTKNNPAPTPRNSNGPSLRKTAIVANISLSLDSVRASTLTKTHVRFSGNFCVLT